MNFTAQDFKLAAKAQKNQEAIEAQIGERITGIYSKDGFVYFRYLSNCQRMGCVLKGLKVVRTFPLT